MTSTEAKGKKKEEKEKELGEVVAVAAVVVLACVVPPDIQKVWKVSSSSRVRMKGGKPSDVEIINKGRSEL